MILPDSSIFIESTRRRGRGLKQRLDSLPIYGAGIVLSEVLKGAKLPADRTRILTYFQTLPATPFEAIHWIALGDNLAALRRKGICVPLGDVILATLAIAYGFEVWAQDKHFPLMQTALPDLKLFSEAV